MTTQNANWTKVLRIKNPCDKCGRETGSLKISVCSDCTDEELMELLL